MKPESRLSRRAEIEAAAYVILHEKGYAGTSMLAVAKAAQASNETLYRWYGDKAGLLAALIDRHGQAFQAQLEGVIARNSDPVAALRQLAPTLLGALTAERAIALNRAAAADETGVLGRALAMIGRERVAILVTGLMEQATAQGQITAASPRIAAEWYISLVIGDAQIRRVIGAVPEPSEAHIAQLAETRVAAFLKLVAPAG